MRQLPPVPVKMDYFALAGGLNQTSPPITMPPGFAIDAVNFECNVNGGYSRVPGYERYSGQPKPSEQVFSSIPCSTAGTWTLGDTITGATSGATAVYLATQGANLIVTKVVGTFQAETLNPGAGTATGASFTGGASTAALEATYSNLTADEYRADISAVPGSGNILGVKYYGSTLYAFRNTANATRAGMYKSAVGGWTAVHQLELTFTSGGTYVMTVGNTITGATSGSTAEISRVVVRSGSFAGGDAAGTLTLVSQSAAFVAENLNVGVNLNVATIAADTTTSMGREMYFTSGGTDTIDEGDTITGNTSAVTAVVTRVVLESGSWAAGTAAGRVIFTADTGSFQAAETLNIGASLNVATVTGASTAITLLPTGRYEFELHNFGGTIATERMYGCDGVNRGFEFDGTVFVPIRTGMTNDTPSHLTIHKEQLFFSFGASAQHSGPATPYVWTPVLGAGELAVGDTISGFMSQPGNTTGGALWIITRNKASVLYGNDTSDWVLTVAQEDAGALPYTMQHLGGIIALDDRGVTYVGTSQNYGNFEQNTITRQVRTFIREKRTLSTASARHRDKNQYRLFFSDGYALYITMNGKKVVGMLPVYLDNPVRCVDSVELSDGTEAIFFGSTNGHVYQMEMGTSNDGEPIRYELVLAYNNSKSPQVNKRYRKLALEMSGDSYAEFSVGYTLGYDDANISQPADSDSSLGFSVNAGWDSFVWDAFFWDGQGLSPTALSMDGTAENVSVAIRGSSDEFNPFTITGVMIHYTPRARIR